MAKTYDVVIIGGGLAGTAAAVAVAGLGLSTLHLAPEAKRDARTSALMAPSVRILQRLGLIFQPEALGTALSQIRIIDATRRLIRAPEALFDAREGGHPAFGWNFANAALLTAFQDREASLSTLVRRPTALKAITRTGSGFRLQLEGGELVGAHLVVGADGKRSMVRDFAGISVQEFSHKSSALVSDLELERSIGNTSVEFHYENGPFTLVPAGGNKANLVWIDRPAVLNEARQLPREGLLALLGEKSQHHFGAVVTATAPVIFPLTSIFVREAGRGGIALVGEAAHAFPPIGAQGLNLGLRDVDDLVASLQAVDRTQTGWAAKASAHYARARRVDLMRTGAMVDTLYASLILGFLPAQGLRAGGLWALRTLPFLRRRAFAMGMGQR